MSRPARYAPGGMVFHATNRGVGQRTIFENDEDYLAFERVVEETLRVRPIRLCGYCLMPNHWHFVLWPEGDGDLPRFIQQLTNTHVKRWKRCHQESGSGHLYQGRYKSFPVQTEDHFYRVVRYVERNALRAGLVDRAEVWPWSSLGRAARDDPKRPLLSSWPLPRPADWLEIVNRPQSDGELQDLRRCIKRGRPFGGEDWVSATAKHLGLESTMRPQGRPRKRT